MKGKTVTFNKQAGKTTTSEHSFSDQKWGDATQGLTHAAEHHSNTQLAVIIEKVQQAAHDMQPDTSGETVFEDDARDEYARICKSFHHLSECANMFHIGSISLFLPLHHFLIPHPSSTVFFSLSFIFLHLFSPLLCTASFTQLPFALDFFPHQYVLRSSLFLSYYGTRPCTPLFNFFPVILCSGIFFPSFPPCFDISHCRSSSV